MIESWKSAGLYDLWKLYSSLKLVSESLEEGTVEVHVDYRLDRETSWTPMVELFKDSPSEELAFRDDLTLKGKRVGLRLRFLTETATIAPVVETTLMEVAAQVPVTKSFSAPFRLMEGNPNLQGDPDPVYRTAEELNDQLLDYAVNLVPLVFEATSSVWHGQVVFLNPAPLRANFDTLAKRDRFIGEMSVLVIRPLSQKAIKELAGV